MCVSLGGYISGIVTGYTHIWNLADMSVFETDDTNFRSHSIRWEFQLFHVFGGTCHVHYLQLLAIHMGCSRMVL